MSWEKLPNCKLGQGDCLELMQGIPDGSVDMVLTDPPYGTTACKWDAIIPLQEMWDSIFRVAKKDAAIILTSVQPFTSVLVNSQISIFKHDWVWHKSKSGSSFTAKYRPLAKHESVLVFCRGKLNYNPILEPGEPYVRCRKANKGDKPNNHNLGVVSESVTINTGFRYPGTVQFFQQKWRRQDQVHPTQKPVTLMEYLIKTYSSENDLVLDFTMGSGTTGVACMNLNRRFIGIEKDATYFAIAKNRIQKTIEANASESAKEPSDAV